MELVCVDPARVREIWPHAGHLIRAAVERTGLTSFERIENEVLDGKQLVWLAWNGEAIEAAATTQLVRPVCVITACAGEQHKRWVSLLSQIEQYARNEGCSVSRIFGRRGWERVLDGYQVKHVIMEKAL